MWVSQCAVCSSVERGGRRPAVARCVPDQYPAAGVGSRTGQEEGPGTNTSTLTLGPATTGFDTVT